MISVRGRAMGVLIFASFMDLMDATIVNVALPSIGGSLGATGEQLEWVVSSYLLAFAVLMISGGRLGDIVGRRRVFVVGVLGLTAGSALAGAAPTIGVLVAARVWQGAAAAMMVPQVLSSLQSLYPARERAPLYGVIGAVSGLSAVLGPVLGGWLVTADPLGVGWRGVFLINLPIGIALVVLALRWVPETRSAHPLRLDLVGLTLATAGLLGVMYALVEGRQAAWAPWIVGVGAAGIAVLTAFVVQQRRGDRRTRSALLPMRLFSDRGFSAGLVAQGAFQGALAGFTFALTVYLQTGLGWSAIQTGATLLPFSLSALVGTAVAVPLGVRLGKVVVVSGALLQAAATVWVLAVVTGQRGSVSPWSLLPALATSGIGLGLLVVPLVDIALATIATSEAGAASGTYGTIQQVGAAFGIAVAGTVFFGIVGMTQDSDSLGTGFVAACWVAAAGHSLAGVAGLLLPSRAQVRRRRETIERELDEGRSVTL